MKAGLQEKNKRGNRKPTLLSAAESPTKPAFFQPSAAFLGRCGVPWGPALPRKTACTLSSLNADKSISSQVWALSTWSTRGEGAAAGEVLGCSARPRVSGFSPVSHEQNWTQSSPQVREGWVWLWGSGSCEEPRPGRGFCSHPQSQPALLRLLLLLLPPSPCFTVWVLHGNPGKAASLGVPGAHRGAAWWAAHSVLGFCGREEGMKY